MDSDDISDDEKEFDVPEESKISKTLSDKTTRTVVILVLILLFLLALCSIDSYTETDLQHKAALTNLIVLYNTNLWPAYQTAHKHLIDTTRSENNEYPLIYFEAPDPTSKEKTTKLKIDTWKGTANYVDHLSLRKEEFSAENQYGWAMENGKNNT